MHHVHVRMIFDWVISDSMQRALHLADKVSELLLPFQLTVPFRCYASLLLVAQNCFLNAVWIFFTRSIMSL